MSIFSAHLSALVLAILTLGSYVAGFFRDRTFAQTFGASRELDAYNAAFIIPDFLFHMFIASGIAAAVVPLFTELWRSDRNAARAYANTIITSSVIAMAILSLLVVVFAENVAAIAAPGFNETDRQNTATLIRLLALSPILFSASNALGALLVARRRLFFYGLSPIFYNGGIILGTVLFAGTMGIRGAVVGTLLGGLLHLGLRIVDIYRSGFRYQPTLRLTTPEFKKTIRLMLPKMVGHPLELATFWGFTAIASTLAAGSIAALNFARNFQSVPVGVIGIAAATAAFPLLAHAAAERSPEQFRKALWSSAALIGIFSILSAILLFVIREPLLAIAFGGGAFDSDAINRTAAALGVFAFAVPSEALAQLFSRAYYATKNTTLPVLFSVIGFVLALGIAWYLVPSLGLVALPFGFVAGSLIKVIFLALFLPNRIRSLSTKA